MPWDWELYLKEEIEKIKELKKNGKTDREIIDMNRFSYEAQEKSGLALTYLIPTLEGQDMTLQEWDTHTSDCHKFEYFDNTCFGNYRERDRVLLGLLYNAGLERFMEILPEQSKKDLIKLIKENYM